MNRNDLHVINADVVNYIGLTITMIDRRTQKKFSHIVSGSGSQEWTDTSSLQQTDTLAEDRTSSNRAAVLKQEVFRHNGGISELVSSLCDGKTGLFNIESKGTSLPVTNTRGGTNVYLVGRRGLAFSEKEKGGFPNKSDGDDSNNDIILVCGTKADVVSFPEL